MAKKSKTSKSDAVRAAHENKKETTNPFDLRFNKIKRKVVNQKLHSCDYGANPLQSKQRALQLRKDTLLEEYKNKNKSTQIVVNKNKKTTPKATETVDKRQQHAEHMNDLFRQKLESRLEKERLDNLKNKLDDQWAGLRSSLRPSKDESEEKLSTDNVDDYDLILNDLMYNKGERCVRGQLLKGEEDKNQEHLQRPNIIPISQSNITAFEQHLDKITTHQSYEQVKLELESFMNFKKFNSAMCNRLRVALVEVDSSRPVLNNAAVLLLASTVSSLKSCVHFKLAEILKTASLDSIDVAVNLIYYIKLTSKLMGNFYSPESIKSINNLLILSLRPVEYDKNFLPLYKIQKLKQGRHFMTLNEFVQPKEAFEFCLESVCLSKFQSLSTDEQKTLLFLQLKQLIVDFIAKYKSLDAFDSIFFFTNKLLVALQQNHSPFASHVDELLDLLVRFRPEVSQIQLPKPPPVMLAMFEPDFNDNDLKPSPKKQEKEMKRKLRREMKSARREIQKDSAFIQGFKSQETMERDRVRKEKVKRLIQEINVERSLFKK